MLEGSTEGEEFGTAIGIEDGTSLGAKLGDGNARGGTLGAPDGKFDGMSHTEAHGKPSRNPPVSDQIKSLSKPQPLSSVHFPSSSAFVQRRPPALTQMFRASQ